MVLIFGMGVSIGSIWTHNGPWVTCISISVLGTVRKEHPPHAADGDSTENHKVRMGRVAETGRGHATGFQLLGCVEGDLGRR